MALLAPYWENQRGYQIEWMTVSLLAMLVIYSEKLVLWMEPKLGATDGESVGADDGAREGAGVGSGVGGKVE